MALKIFELRWNSQDEKEWIAANTNIEAIQEYCKITGTDLCDLYASDEIVEIPESEHEAMFVKNTDYDAFDPEDWEKMSLKEFLVRVKLPTIIAGTMYE